MTRRRDFLKLTASTVLTNCVSFAAAEDSVQVENPRYRDLRGFNYQPSYGSSGFEIWQKFDLETIDRELSLGKKYLPKMSAIRLWLSWDSFIRDPKLFESRFESTLACASAHGLVVMPVLFNRWHDHMLDYGGIYIEHILLASSKRQELFKPYLESVVGKHASDARIFCWDMCNEPVLQSVTPTWTVALRDAEYSWLSDVYVSCKALKAQAPLSIGTGSLKDVEFINDISDVITIHPYFAHSLPGESAKLNGAMEFSSGHALQEALEDLDQTVAFANRTGKPVLASETCWGSLSDQVRVSIIQTTLSELKKRGIGWTSYLLHHSLIADAHRPEFGPIDHAGYMAFIEKDGSLRPGHGVWNSF